MNREKFRLHCSICRVETSLFISILQARDWIKTNKEAKYHIEYLFEKISNKIREKSLERYLIDDRECNNISLDKMQSIFSDLVSIYNLICCEFDILGGKYPKLANNCKLAKNLLLVRIEGELSKPSELGDIGDDYGNRNRFNRRVCWEVEWGSVERSL